MTDAEVVKKKKSQKASLESCGHVNEMKRETLAHIVLSNGSVVEIPKLPLNGSELTTYDNLRIAMEYAALATSCLNQLDLAWDPKKANQFSITLESFQYNLEDLMSHLYYAIEGYPKEKGSS